MSDHIISLLFPTPILSTKLDRDFTEEELASASKHELDTIKNIGNRYSSNHRILEEPEFADLKKFCMSVVTSYIDNIVKPKNKITPYITQSWLNYCKVGDYMHQHNHSNSYLSGALYLNADPAFDKLYFHDQSYKQLVIPSDSYDISNSSNWWLPVGTGDIIVFPSHLTHSVAHVELEENRISLAFNVFIDGVLGTEGLLTELNLTNLTK